MNNSTKSNNRLCSTEILRSQIIEFNRSKDLDDTAPPPLFDLNCSSEVVWIFSVLISCLIVAVTSSSSPKRLHLPTPSYIVIVANTSIVVSSPPLKPHSHIHITKTRPLLKTRDRRQEDGSYASSVNTPRPPPVVETKHTECALAKALREPSTE